MKLSLETAAFDQRQIDQIKEELENELASELSEVKGSIQEADQRHALDYSQTEIFRLGLTIGRTLEKRHWTKPEEMHLPKDYADLLRQAISEYQKESYIRVDSISFKAGLNENTETIVVAPTLVPHLFNIAARYGKLVMQKGETA